MIYIALTLVLCCLWIPGAAADLSPSPVVTQDQGVKPLRTRVVQLERRVKRLETNVATLRVLVCLQLPTC